MGSFVPRIFIGETAELHTVLRQMAKHKGMPDEVVDSLLALLPARLLTLPCFLDRLTGLWRYVFGNPFDGLPSGRLIFGTHMYLLVEQFLDVLSCASIRLSQEELCDYLKRLDDPNKHSDLVFEFAPIIQLPEDINATYEVTGFGKGATKVDWCLTAPNGISLLLEVKNRSRDLWESMIRLEKIEGKTEGKFPAPTHDASLLFRDIDKKFLSRAPSEILQGAWIGTDIKQEEKELQLAFQRLDSSKVHFAVLGDFKPDVYVLAQNNGIKFKVLEILQKTESDRFVFFRDDV